MFLFLACALTLAEDANWPQFRGPGGLGIGTGGPPVEFGPEKNVLWKVAVPHGHSSPCIWGDRIALTALDGGKLVTICLSRKDGRELWRAIAPAEKIEETHRIGSPASSTPCTDGKRLYVAFGSFGVLAYDWDGQEIWRKPLPAPVVEFGTGASPILADGKVILVRDQDVGSHLLALDAATGAEVWRTDRPQFRRSFSTPLLWTHDGTEELVVGGSLAVRSYSVNDGRELWSVQGAARVSNASPVAGDGMLFYSSWNVGGDEDGRVEMVPHEEFIAQYDRNHDDLLTEEEFPPGPVRQRFSQIDADKDGRVTQQEYEYMRGMFASADNQLLAIRPGGHGEITRSHVAWAMKKHLPYVSSPLNYQGRIFTMKNGGLASSYDARDGSVLYQAERVDAPGDYYSSPVAADGRVYVTSQRGTVVVLDAGGTFRVLARNPIGEPVFATPAIVGGRIYLRTDKSLFAFGE
jgi:outer membrane protein assembly factor BamB